MIFRMYSLSSNLKLSFRIRHDMVFSSLPEKGRILAMSIEHRKPLFHPGCRWDTAIIFDVLCFGQENDQFHLYEFFNSRTKCQNCEKFQSPKYAMLISQNNAHYFSMLICKEDF